MAVSDYLEQLTILVDSLEQFNDSDAADTARQLILEQHKSDIRVKEAMRTRRNELTTQAQASGKTALNLLLDADIGSTYKSDRPRLFKEGKIVEGRSGKWFGDVGFKGGGLPFDFKRRRTEVEEAIKMHKEAMPQLFRTTVGITDQKYLLGDDHELVQRAENKLIEERNHLVDFRNNLMNIDTYAKASEQEGWELGQKIMRGDEVGLLEEIDSLLSKYDQAFELADIELESS